MLVYGETGRYPLFINVYVKCIKYWLRVLRMPSNRLPLKAYAMLLDLHQQDKVNWVSSVCSILYRYGFGHVWQSQGVGDSNIFLSTFKYRLKDCFQQLDNFLFKYTAIFDCLKNCLAAYDTSTKSPE